MAAAWGGAHLRVSGQSRRWRLVVDGARDAVSNMSRDEAIMRSVRSGAPPTLRFYAWRPWAFSLGYFQEYADFATQRERGITVVRRPTGGGAIYHADEVTYSLSGRFGGGEFPRRAADIFEKVHKAILRGLVLLGVEASLSDAPTGKSAIICFQRPQRFDIVAGERKLLGSAQRRFGGCFLQHGSLPLSANEFAPEATSLAQCLGGRPEESVVTDALVEGFEAAFGVDCVRGVLSRDEEEAAATLAAEKYGSDEWNRRR